MEDVANGQIICMHHVYRWPAAAYDRAYERSSGGAGAIGNTTAQAPRALAQVGGSYRLSRLKRLENKHSDGIKVQDHVPTQK